MTGISLASNAIQNSLPGGVVFYAAYLFRQYRRFGADDILAGWTLVALNALSFVTLAAVAAVGLGLALGAGSALDLVEVILGIVMRRPASWCWPGRSGTGCFPTWPGPYGSRSASPTGPPPTVRRGDHRWLVDPGRRHQPRAGPTGRGPRG